MTDFKIESGILISEHTYRKKKNGKWVSVFRKMNDGDSFFFEGCDLVQRNTILQSINRNRHEFKVASRSVDGGVRFWRVRK